MLAHMAKLGRSNEIACPDLSPSPALAIRQAEDLLAGHRAEDICIMGSSLGGYYATWLAEKYGCKAILLNPAVKPPRDLESYVGVTTYYHSDRVFEFRAGYVDELRALVVDRITQPERYFLIAATGDEVLDWREMVSHYPGAKQFVIEGSDHGIAEFADYLDMVMAFCDEKS